MPIERGQGINTCDGMKNTIIKNKKKFHSCFFVRKEIEARERNKRDLIKRVTVPTRGEILNYPSRNKKYKCCKRTYINVYLFFRPFSFFKSQIQVMRNTASTKNNEKNRLQAFVCVCRQERVYTHNDGRLSMFYSRQHNKKKEDCFNMTTSFVSSSSSYMHTGI